MRIEKLDGSAGYEQPKKLRVAAYARVSVEKEATLDSLENQVETYTSQIRANPEWEFAGVYEDRGISGTKEMRPEFQRMLADCRAGKIDLILTKSFTRFARNTVVLLNTLRELKELGIEVVFEKDNIRSLNESGELLITLLAAFAQAESFSASENQKWRIRKAFEEGKIINGLRMLGYRCENYRLVIVPEEAEIVRQIYSDYLSGMGMLAIAKKLNRQRVPTLNNKLWVRSTIRHILCNEKYTGDMILQKTFVDNYISKKTVKNRGERTQYLVENSHEAIITKDVFAAVQERIRRQNGNVSEKKTGREKYLFTGIIRCGKCGKGYQHKFLNCGTKYEKPLWSCYTFNTIGKEICNNKQIPEDILIAKTAEVLGTDDLAEAIPKLLKEIRAVEAGHLVYVFKDGTEKEVFWENRSRSESWTEEMRQQARERALARYRKEGQNG